MKRVLVIGGSGFAGRHLLKGLAKGDYEVTAVQHMAPVNSDKNVRVIPGGLGVVGRRLIRDTRPDLIFHFGRTKFPRFRKPGRILAGRYAAFQNRRLVHGLEKTGLPCRLIFASGSLMYGASPSPLDEDTPLMPASYARQYQHGEKPILEAMESGRIRANVIRFPWLLGTGSWFEWFYLRPMMISGAIPLFGSGDNLMDIIDIEDAVMLALTYIDKFEARGTLNIVAAGPVTQLEFADAISRVFDLPVRDYREVVPGRIEKEAIESFTSTITLATKYPELAQGFPYHTLEDTIRRIRKEFGKL